MNKKDLLFTFIKTIENNNLLTEFIVNIFDYSNFHDYNYIFRISDNSNDVIIDIYDNISDNRFNRYVFSFFKNSYDILINNDGNVYVTSISVNNINNMDNKLYKLAYMFSDNCGNMLCYAKTFLDGKFVNILRDIINKPI